jgi:cytochrome oxidase Cu insertion factor (SCO1/SenC/PrrC family)
MRKIAILALLGLLLSGCASTDDHASHSATIDDSNFTQASPAPDGGTFLHSKISKSVQNIDLQDSNGKTFTLKDLQGRIVVLANFYTSCSHVCPMTSANMKQISNEISAAGLSEKITVLEVSVDGDRDTVNRIDAYQKLYGEKSWVMATASQDELVKFWKFFGVIPEAEPVSKADQKNEPADWQTGKPNTYRMIDAPVVVLIDPSSKWRWLNTGFPAASKDYVPTALMNYLSEHGLDSLNDPGEGAWTLKSVYSALKEISGYEIG